MQYNEARKEVARKTQEWLESKRTVPWEAQQKRFLLGYGLSKKVTDKIRKELEE